MQGEVAADRGELVTLNLAPVDLKVMAGYLATSKKSSARRWVSSFSSPVLIELASMLMSTEAFLAHGPARCCRWSC